MSDKMKKEVKRRIQISQALEKAKKEAADKLPKGSSGIEAKNKKPRQN